MSVLWELLASQQAANLGPHEGMGRLCPTVFGIPFCWGIPMAASVISRPSVGGPSTRLNRVAEGGQQLSLGLSNSRPSRMSRLVMVTNSLMAKHSSFMYK